MFSYAIVLLNIIISNLAGEDTELLLFFTEMSAKAQEVIAYCVNEAVNFLGF